MTKPKKSTSTMRGEFGRWLVYGAAAFQAYHMGRAFHVYDPAGWHFANVNLGGFILGAILNVIVAQTAMKLPSMSATFASLKQLMPRGSKKADGKDEQARARALKRMTLAMKQNAYSQFGFYTLLFFSALMVAPALYILWTETLPFPPVFIGIMAMAGAVAPDVAITVGGFAASDGLFRSADRSHPLSEGSGTGATRSGKGSGRRAKAAKPAAIVPCPHAGAGCERTGTQNAMNAHAGKCRFKPTISMPVDISKLEK